MLAPLHAEWRWFAPLPQGNSLFGLYASPTGESFAVGRSGTIIHGDTLWSGCQSDTRGWLFSIWGDSAHLFAAGENGTILRSSDNGSSWKKLSKSSNAFFFGGASVGDVSYVVGSYGAILSTHDHGETWQALRTGKELLYQLHATASGELFVIGAKGALLHSTSGVSWQKISLETDEDLFSIASSKDNLYITGSGGTLFRSTDGGKTFTAQSIAAQALNSIITKERSVWVAGNNGLLMRSTDDGVHWRTSQSPTSLHLNSIKETSKGELLAVGALGVIIKSSDRGETWRLVSSTQKKSLNAAQIALRADAWEYLFVSGAGIVYQLHPGSLGSYEELSRAVTWASLRGVAALSTGELIAISEAGSIFRSTDGGMKWFFIKKLGPLSAIAGDEKRLTTVGANGEIWASTDRGLTWRQEANEDKSDLRAIWQDATGARFAVNEDGVLLRSKRQKPWQPVQLYTSKRTNAIWGHAGAIYIAGEDGLLLRSLDKGDTWQELESGVTKDLFALWGNDRGVFAAGEDGVIVRTADGEHWVREETPTESDLFFLAGSPSGELFAGGEAGVILISSWVR